MSKDIWWIVVKSRMRISFWVVSCMYLYTRVDVYSGTWTQYRLHSMSTRYPLSCSVLKSTVWGSSLGVKVGTSSWRVSHRTKRASNWIPWLATTHLFLFNTLYLFIKCVGYVTKSRMYTVINLMELINTNKYH